MNTKQSQYDIKYICPCCGFVMQYEISGYKKPEKEYNTTIDILRRWKGLSVKDMADACKVKYATVYTWCAGRRSSMTPVNFDILCSLFGIPNLYYRPDGPASFFIAAITNDYWRFEKTRDLKYRRDLLNYLNIPLDPIRDY